MPRSGNPRCHLIRASPGRSPAMIKSCALVLSFCLVVCIARARADERPTVVELFTSEGCSSCPPADALLAELATRPDVLALSFHVDYWDGLGWKDPFSGRQATQRQERYRALLDLTTIYTPQIIVDGRWQAVGSDRAEVEHALDLARRDRRDIPMTLAVNGSNALFKLRAASEAVSASVLLVGFDRRHSSAVKGGENSGRTLAHADVVRGVDEVGQFSGNPSEFAAPIRWHCERVAAIIQAGDGRILGVAVSDAE
ncbi:MAG: DUF1223 domain-containing protein [Alphaproteobacteria bacterium]|nr:DUF1223 domain-containing protein [Alphaproteobacteria bacterium]MBV8335183.1 DUF1223 domain-containing protein [Alphaproteobacteria bacterium]